MKWCSRIGAFLKKFGPQTINISAMWTKLRQKNCPCRRFRAHGLFCDRPNPVSQNGPWTKHTAQMNTSCVSLWCWEWDYKPSTWDSQHTLCYSTCDSQNTLCNVRVRVIYPKFAFGRRLSERGSTGGPKWAGGPNSFSGMLHLEVDPVPCTCACSTSHQHPVTPPLVHTRDRDAAATQWDKPIDTSHRDTQ